MKSAIRNKSIICIIILLFFGASVVSAINNSIDSTKASNEIRKLNRDTLTFYPNKDTHIRHVYPNTNYGSFNELVTRNEYGGGGSPGYGIDTLIEFDISEIPPGTTIITASLNLYYSRLSENNPAGRTLTLHKITSDWDEDVVTWNTKPSYNAEVSSSADVPSSTGQWMTWDVISDVQDFVDDLENNYGWELIDGNYWGSGDIPVAYFRSTEGGDNIPYIEIEIENGGSEVKTIIIIGKIDNLNTGVDTITFEAVNIRCIQFFPFGFIPYTSGEQITVSDQYFGLLTPNIVFGFFNTDV